MLLVFGRSTRHVLFTTTILVFVPFLGDPNLILLLPYQLVKLHVIDSVLAICILNESLYSFAHYCMVAMLPREAITIFGHTYELL